MIASLLNIASVRNAGRPERLAGGEPDGELDGKLELDDELEGEIDDAGTGFSLGLELTNRLDGMDFSQIFLVSNFQE